MTPGTQPLVSSQNCPAGHAVGPLVGPTTCEHTPAAQVSIVHENPSLQSAALPHPPEPPVPLELVVVEVAVVLLLVTAPPWPPLEVVPVAWPPFELLVVAGPLEHAA